MYTGRVIKKEVMAEKGLKHRVILLSSKSGKGIPDRVACARYTE